MTLVAAREDYGDCGTNSCNQYISDRVCNEDTIGEDSQAPSDDFYRVGVLRSLSSGPESDFATMCAWEKARKDGLMSNVADLDMLWIDTGSGVSGGVQSGLCMRESGINLAVGPLYSSVAQGASIIGTIYEKNVIGATSTSPLLSDTDSYSYFSRVIPSDNYQGAMLAEYAVNTQGWTKIATLSISSEAYFEGITNVFAETAVSLGAEVTSYTLTSGFTESQISEALRKIRASGVRVVMIAMEPARDALVIANATGMLDEGWAWLTTESTITTLSSNLWGLPEEKLVDMEKLLHGFIGLVPWMDTEGQTYQDWLSCVDSHYDDTTGMFANLGAMLTAANGNSVEVGKSKAKDMWNGYFYDAMMLALRALHPLTASERANATRIREAIRETTYNGTSGSIALDAAGDRSVATYDILNIYNEAQNSVGTIDAGTRTVTTFQAEIFPGNTTTVPVDFVMACSNEDYNMTVSACANSLRTVTLTQNSEDALRYCPDIEAFEASCDHASLKSAGAGLVMFGYAFIFIFLLALARVWSHKVIRLSQRKFLLIMIFGAFVALTGPLLSVDELSAARCAALPCFTAVGYVLLFGPLFVKTWRVSVLMNNSRLRSKKVSNWRLYRRLAALIVATVGLLAVMLLVDPPKPQTSSKPVDDADGNVHLVPFETCAVESGTLGMLVILLLGLMTAYGCFVSYQIRNVTSELSEARWIFLSVYNGALLSMVTLAVVLGLDLTYAELHLFASLGSVLTCMVTVSLIMVPKLINIHKDVKFTMLTGAGTTAVNPSSAAGPVSSVAANSAKVETAAES